MNFEANDYFEVSVYMSILSTYCHACFLNLSMICLPVLCFVSGKSSPFWIIRQGKENTPENLSTLAISIKCCILLRNMERLFVP